MNFITERAVATIVLGLLVSAAVEKCEASSDAPVGLL